MFVGTLYTILPANLVSIYSDPLDLLHEHMFTANNEGLFTSRKPQNRGLQVLALVTNWTWYHLDCTAALDGT
jgi:hypothetical protein